MLELSDVDVKYGRSQALFGVSFSVAAGEAVALVGANGAGKSTTLKAIAGLVPPSAGSIRFQERELSGLPSHRIARAGVGYVPEGRRLFAPLSVAENLETGRRSGPTGARWTEEAVLALFPPLKSLMRRSAGTLSGGEQQMAAIGRTLMGNPTLLLLDEPAEGLAPLVVEDLVVAMKTLKAEGLAILLSDQSPRFAAHFVDRVVAMERGRVVASNG